MSRALRALARLRALRRDARGSVGLFWVLGFVPMLSFFAIVSETGFVDSERRSLQNAADAAALAGVQTLSAGPGQAIADAQIWADKNVDGLLVNEAAVSADGTQLTVRLRRAPGAIFSGELSLGASEVEATATAAIAVQVVDFEGLAEGQTVTTLSSGQGISGESVPGWIEVSGTGYGAMVFDGTCDGGPASNCSGGDADLFVPPAGNILIISEDGDGSDPDDDAGGGTFELDFSNFGGGSITVGSLVIVGAEEGGTVELFSGGQLVTSVQLTGIGDGEFAARFIGGVPAIDFMRVTLPGSGAIDSIGFYEFTRLVG